MAINGQGQSVKNRAAGGVLRVNGEMGDMGTYMRAILPQDGLPP